MPDELVEGGSIRWRRLASVIVAAIFLPIVSFAVGFVDLLMSTPGAAIGRLAGWVERVIGTAIGIPGTTLAAAGAETESWLAMLGPAALPVAIVIVIVAVFLLVRTGQVLASLLMGGTGL